MAEIRTDIANATAARSNLHPTTFTDRENFLKFSFGYFVGFYFIVLLLVPVLLLTIPAKRTSSLPHKILGVIPVCVFGHHLPENDAEMGVAPVGR